jgi:hypothetical protein
MLLFLLDIGKEQKKIDAAEDDLDRAIKKINKTKKKLK